VVGIRTVEHNFHNLLPEEGLLGFLEILQPGQEQRETNPSEGSGVIAFLANDVDQHQREPAFPITLPGLASLLLLDAQPPAESAGAFVLESCFVKATQQRRPAIQDLDAGSPFIRIGGDNSRKAGNEIEHGINGGDKNDFAVFDVIEPLKEFEFFQVQRGVSDATLEMIEDDHWNRWQDEV